MQHPCFRVSLPCCYSANMSPVNVARAEQLVRRWAPAPLSWKSQARLLCPCTVLFSRTVMLIPAPWLPQEFVQCVKWDEVSKSALKTVAITKNIKKSHSKSSVLTCIHHHILEMSHARHGKRLLPKKIQLGHWGNQTVNGKSVTTIQGLSPYDSCSPWHLSKAVFWDQSQISCTIRFWYKSVKCPLNIQNLFRQAGK